MAGKFAPIPSNPPAMHMRPLGNGIVQRMEQKYVDERNKEDIEHAQKNFSNISKYVKETKEKGARGKFAIYTVDFGGLPKKVQEAIKKIKSYDPEEEALGDIWKLSEFFRYDIHENRGGHLPELSLGESPTSKQKSYEKYTKEAKKKDLSGNTAHYAEFHVTDSGLGKAFRILYDYVGDKYYITISHYNIWKDKGDIERNPFFQVVNIGN